MSAFESSTTANSSYSLNILVRGKQLLNNVKLNINCETKSVSSEETPFISPDSSEVKPNDLRGVNSSLNPVFSPRGDILVLTEGKN